MNDWDSVKGLQMLYSLIRNKLCGRLDFMHMYDEKSWFSGVGLAV